MFLYYIQSPSSLMGKHLSQRVQSFLKLKLTDDTIILLITPQCIQYVLYGAKWKSQCELTEGWLTAMYLPINFPIEQVTFVIITANLQNISRGPPLTTSTLMSSAVVEIVSDGQETGCWELVGCLKQFSYLECEQDKIEDCGV